MPPTPGLCEGFLATDGSWLSQGKPWGVVEEAEEGLPLLWMTSSHPAQKGSPFVCSYQQSSQGCGALTHTCAEFLGVSGLQSHWLPG